MTQIKSVPGGAIHILFICLILLSGCSQFGSTNEPGPNYFVGAHVVEQPPSDAEIVPVSDERIANVEPIQEAIDGAKTDNGSQISVTKSEYGRVNEALAVTPLYQNDGDEWVNSTGLYVRTDGQVVRVMVYSQTPA